MRRKDKTAVPAEARAVQSRFTTWRKAKTGRDRIPDRLWSAAVRLCTRHSVDEISRWLRLNHSALRDRVGPKKKRKVRRSRSAPSFAELVPPLASSSAEYVIEVEGTEGKRMRVRLRGASVTEVAELARSLREEAS